ncbi:MAG: hypothetical protein VB954_03265 [Thalassolituus sp.]|uniref:hypothetical protein n=1 Tax=Thalassolituus sp. TaxID=2030822 RepID=UPI003982707B
MDLYVQLGHGMQSLSIDLIKHWKGDGTFILSPRNQKLSQLKNFSKDIKKSNGKVILDPQFYFPRTSLKSLQQHKYWPSNYDTGAFFSKSGVNTLIDTLVDQYHEPLGCSMFIIPTLVINAYDPLWFSQVQLTLESLSRKNIKEDKILTLCLGDSLLLNEGDLHLLIDELETLDVDGFYIIASHPKNQYFVSDPNWLSNLLDLSASLKMLNKKVIWGYCNSQSIIAAISKVDAICTGNFKNTRSFSTEIFDDEERENNSRKGPNWYYCPQALSEYQLPYLTAAYQNSLLSLLESRPTFSSGYETKLFIPATPPDAINFTPADSFKHYIYALKKQCESYSYDTYQDVRNDLNLTLSAALEITTTLSNSGIRGKDRDFSSVAEDTMAALDIFHNNRGLSYESLWKMI